MMTSAQVVETSVNATANSPSQDYTHPDDLNLLTYKLYLEMTARIFFTLKLYLHNKEWEPFISLIEQ